MARKPVKLEENPAGCAGKANRGKEIRRREKDGLRKPTIALCEKGTSRKCEVKGNY